VRLSLSAKDFIGGRERLRADQTSFAQVLKPLGLERGIEGSKAKHQTIRSYYNAVNANKPPELNPQDFERWYYNKNKGGLKGFLGLKETTEDFQKRLYGTFKPIFEAAALVPKLRDELNEAKLNEKRANNNAYRSEAKLKQFTQGLSKAQQEAVLSAVEKLRTNNEREKQIEQAREQELKRQRDLERKNRRGRGYSR